MSQTLKKYLVNVPVMGNISVYVQARNEEEAQRAIGRIAREEGGALSNLGVPQGDLTVDNTGISILEECEVTDR